MGNKYQEAWLDYLPLILLGKNTALQPDIGASPSEMAHGLNVRIPGQLLNDPEEDLTKEELKALLTSVRQKTNIPVSQPSRHNPPEPKLPGIPENATYAYTKQHQTTGLQTAYEGPFFIAERLSNSTVKLEVGLYRNGDKRYEVRHANDLKFAHQDSMAAPASRPALGRPCKRTSTSPQTETSSPFNVRHSTDASGTLSTPSNVFSDKPVDENKQAGDANLTSKNHETSIREDPQPTSNSNGPPAINPFSRPARSTRNPNPVYVDGITLPRPWSASQDEIAELNRLINV